ncbi:MAG: hypothetical protein GF405_07995 [Candidatus Eisenbacteria bacterium]|nr:hypothetical protein [Candidatus Eisenbacteria bacterium]
MPKLARATIILLVVCAVLGTSVTHGVILNSVPVPVPYATTVQAYNPDANGDGVITWYEAIYALIDWILHTGEPDIP